MHVYLLEFCRQIKDNHIKVYKLPAATLSWLTSSLMVHPESLSHNAGATWWWSMLSSLSQSAVEQSTGIHLNL